MTFEPSVSSIIPVYNGEDFIKKLDADDIWTTEKTARQLDFLEANPRAGICISYLQDFWVEELADEP